LSYVDLNTIHNPSTGGIAPASWGDQVRDNLEFLIDPPACSVFHNTTQSIANNTIVTLSANSENYDNDAMHSTVTNNSRITIVTAGRYLIGAEVAWAAVATTISDARLLQLIVNGTTGYNILQGPAHSGGGSGSVYCGFRTLPLVAGDYVEVRVRQQSGGALNVTLDEFFATFLTR
jgi:hypothetical protein